MAYPRRPRTPRPVPKNCPYCAADTTPDYKDAVGLAKYMSDRGKILAHTRTGICSKHQRRIAQAIKQARHVALLPFVGRG